MPSPIIARLTTAALLVALLAACSSTKEPPPQHREAGGRGVVEGEAMPAEDVVQTLWAGPEFGWVRLVKAESGVTALAHPASVSPGWLSEVLAGAQVEDAQGRVENIFTADELDKLVLPIVRGLERARPDEEVVFAVADTRASGLVSWLLQPETVTTGRVFVDDGRVNLIFGLMHESFEGMLRGAGYLKPFTPGSRDRRVGADYRVWSRVRGAERLRGDWVAFGVRGGDSPQPRSPAPRAESQQPVESPPAPATEPVQTGDGRPADDSLQRVRRRLEALKRLHDDGLITDEEYDRKRASILEDL